MTNFREGVQIGAQAKSLPGNTVKAFVMGDDTHLDKRVSRGLFDQNLLDIHRYYHVAYGGYTKEEASKLTLEGLRKLVATRGKIIYPKDTLAVAVYDLSNKKLVYFERLAYDDEEGVEGFLGIPVSLADGSEVWLPLVSDYCLNLGYLENKNAPEWALIKSEDLDLDGYKTVDEAFGGAEASSVSQTGGSTSTSTVYVYGSEAGAVQYVPYGGPGVYAGAYAQFGVGVGMWGNPFWGGGRYWFPNGAWYNPSSNQYCCNSCGGQTSSDPWVINVYVDNTNNNDNDIVVDAGDTDVDVDVDPPGPDSDPDPDGGPVDPDNGDGGPVDPPTPDDGGPVDPDNGRVGGFDKAAFASARERLLQQHAKQGAVRAEVASSRAGNGTIRNAGLELADVRIGRTATQRAGSDRTVAPSRVTSSREVRQPSVERPTRPETISSRVSDNGVKNPNISSRAGNTVQPNVTSRDVRQPGRNVTPSRVETPSREVRQPNIQQRTPQRSQPNVTPSRVTSRPVAQPSRNVTPQRATAQQGRVTQARPTPRPTVARQVPKSPSRGGGRPARATARR